ncbi:MAG: nitroreductase family protein [Bacteroidia bacterium]|nr:nitroreductase family protein [Bacteroidia bacterium]
MSILQTMKNRQSIREYTSEKVSDEHLKLILEAAYNAPIGHAAYNNYEMIVVSDVQKIEQLAKLIQTTRLSAKHPFFHAPLVIFVVGKPSHERLNGCDTGCLIQNMMLEANEIGLGSCFLYTISEVINAHPHLQQALGLSFDQTVMSAVVIGHSQQKDLPIKSRPGIKTRIL